MFEAKDIIVAIPAFNAGHTLDTVLAGVRKHLPREQILVINDGSSDDTTDCAKRNCARLLVHEKNLGKGAALKTAFKYVLRETAAQAVITLDADGQHSPDEIPKFIQNFRQEKSDLVIGARDFTLKAMPLFRLMSNLITSKLLSLKAGQTIPDSQSGYRLYSRWLLQKLELQTNGYETESEIIIQASRGNFKLDFVPIETIYNGATSHIRGFRDVTRFIRLYSKI